ncbi:hypothetical protein HDU67_008031, partial [Dinochytrium kinnereticum]
LFWPAGQLLTATLAWILIPPSSCPPLPTPCPDPLTTNRGWRRVLLALSVVTLVMLVARRVTFRMLESPKFLVARGRVREAVEVLRELARVNGREVAVRVEEFGSREGVVVGPETGLLECVGGVGWWCTGGAGKVRGVGEDGYAMVGEGVGVREGEERWVKKLGVLFGDELRRFLAKFLGNASDRTTPPTPNDTFRDIFIVSIMGIPGSVIGKALPQSTKGMIETRQLLTHNKGMYLIETRLGRRGTMAFSAFGTAVSLFLFTLSTSSLNQLLSSCLAAVLQNIMYGVLYCYTPEVFDSQVRGTATGVASSLSRVFGTMAPVMTGVLLTVSSTLPLYVAAMLIFLSSVAMVFLPIETRGREAM